MTPLAIAIASHDAGFHEGRAPRNKGRRYPADSPTVEEIIAVMRRPEPVPTALGCALIVILWRAG